MTATDHPGRCRRSPPSRSPSSTPCTWAATRYGVRHPANRAEPATCCSAANPAAGKSSRAEPDHRARRGYPTIFFKLILVDGKRVELGPWRDCADVFVGPSIDDAIAAFEGGQRPS